MISEVPVLPPVNGIEPSLSPRPVPSVTTATSPSLITATVEGFIPVGTGFVSGVPVIEAKRWGFTRLPPLAIELTITAASKGVTNTKP